MIYFSHKLADEVSIYQSIYALGCNLKKEDKNKNDSLIKGCNYNKIKFTNYIENKKCSHSEYNNDLANYIEKGEMCPYPFYKKFQYTINGNKITRYGLLDEIKNEEAIKEDRNNLIIELEKKLKSFDFQENEIKKIIKTIPFNDTSLSNNILYKLINSTFNKAVTNKAKKLRKHY